ITVSAVDEDLDVENVPFTLTLTTLEQGTSKNNVYGVNVVTTTIQMTKLDNDTSEVVMTMVDNFTSEDDSNNTGSFKVNLTSRPLDNVRVDLQVEDSSSSLILNPDNLTFTGGVSGNWKTPQTVTVVAVDDDYDEGEYGIDNQTFVVSVKKLCSSYGTQVDGCGMDSSDKHRSLATLDSYDNLSFVVEDNDTAGVVIASIDNNSKESGNNGTLTVKLQSRPFDRVTVNFAADNRSFMETYRGIRLDPDNLIFDNTSSDNWSTPQTIQVVSYDDHLDEGEYGKDNQTFNVWLKNISNTGGHEHDSKFSDEIKALIVQGIDTDNLSLASEDNDTTGVVISSIDNNSKESGETGTVAIKLQSRPFGSLRVFLAADNASGRGIYLNPGFLNFVNRSGNWSSTQTIQIVSNDDDYDEGVLGSYNQTFNFWLDNVTNTGNDHEDNKSEANLNTLI
ncbi:MAG: hypothetical protein VX003_10555, partial [SAR324 cluster bacterium]|nr:hypothetical protein [SAR324 cluster bacterium]